MCPSYEAAKNCCFLRDNAEETGENLQTVIMDEHNFLSAHCMLNENVLLTYVEVQAKLFRLFVLGCIHLLSS